MSDALADDQPKAAGGGSPDGGGEPAGGGATAPPAAEVVDTEEPPPEGPGLGRSTNELAGPRATATSYQVDDGVRAQVARALVALLSVVVLFAFLTLWLIAPPPSIADLEKLLTIVFGPLIALVSGAVGYYFGGKFRGDGG